MVFCVICEKNSDAWIPHPQRARQSEFIKCVGAVGSDLSRYMCANCGCNDRDRHLWMYMKAARIPARVAGSDILHFAPETHIEQLLRAFGPRSYTGCDLFPKNPNHVRVDCENIQFEDNRFDLIIFNHILEHVSSPQRAVSELTRCLKPGGLLIAQTPYAPDLKNTFEFVAVPSEVLCRFFFGQEDHVRLFGGDVGNVFRSAGLKGGLYPHQEILPAIDALAYGCNEKEPFFLFAKEPCPQFPF